MNENLREALKSIDPMGTGVRTEPATTPSSRARMERIMSTSTLEKPRAVQPRNRCPRWIQAAAAAVAVAVGSVGFALANRGDSQPVALPLDLTAPSPASAMCIALSADILAQAPVAFEGTVTAVDGDQATLTVDHWYTGGTASEVVITAPGGLLGLIDGFDVVQGEQYLISATDGVINYCGYSGLVTPELQRLFGDAFPS